MIKFMTYRCLNLPPVGGVAEKPKKRGIYALARA